MATKKSLTRKKQPATTKGVKELFSQKVAVVIIVVLALAMAGYMGWRAVRAQQNVGRVQQIVGIYDSLNLGDGYRTNLIDIFGDKRTYDWDKSRTFASRVEYAHNDTPQNTRADLKQKLLAAGFTFVQTEYEGSVQPIDEYKNGTGNYVRVAVVSKVAQDHMIYGTASATDPAINHANEAPSYVTIKVNLDDNNE